MSDTPSSTIRVLVVDDSALVRQAISEALARDPALKVVGTSMGCRSTIRRTVVAYEPVWVRNGPDGDHRK